MFNSVSRVLNLRFRSFFLPVLVFLAPCVTGINAQTNLPAPVLFPYTTVLIAGNPAQTTGGYSGDGGKAFGTSLNSPSAVAVDSVGNIYIADTSNAVIREINAQTGIIRIIAGIAPGKCAQTVCTANPGYADGVAATSTGVGSGIRGLAVDGYGNVFFSDTNQQDVRVLFKGGTQVANLIALEDPSAAPSASAVTPGNIYLIAGQPTGPTKGTSSPAVDGVLATKATFNKLAQIGLDGAGNIYVQDPGNGVARVINTQSKPQTFFGYMVQPGFIQAIVDCSAAFTVPCNSNYGIGLLPNQALFGSALAGMAVDRFGNVYMTDTKGADPIYMGVAYAGGAALAHLINLENPAYTAKANTWYDVFNADPNNGAAATTSKLIGIAPANKYGAGSGLVIRPSAISVDNTGNIYYLDNHWPAIFRVDVNSQVAFLMSGTAQTNGTATTPAPCATGLTITTNDTYGDGCPTGLARVSGNGQMATDSAGNVYLADSGEMLVRKLSVNNQFPATALGSSSTQTLQVHFDQTNLPAVSTGTSSPVQIQTGNTDFAISTAPACSNVTTGIDASIDCIVSVTFKPTQPGLRTAALQATAASGAVYNFTLTGTGTGSALVIDGGSQVVVAAAGLGKVTSVAIDSVGNQYIADPANNRVVVLAAGTGSQTTVGTGLSRPQGVAVDATGNVYIADTGNNKVVAVNANTKAQTVLAAGLVTPQGIAVDRLGNVYVVDAGDYVAATSTTAGSGSGRLTEISSNLELGTSTLLQFNGGLSSAGLKTPSSVAVDSLGNVYVADPGAKSVFVLPAGGGDLQTVIGPTSVLATVGSNLKTPDGVAVDAAGDVYIADSTLNAVIEKPSSTGPGSEQFNLSFTGLNAPAGLALDSVGNVYLADSGNSRVLQMNRTTATVNFGNLPLFQPALIAALTVGNIGNQTDVLPSPAFHQTGNTADFGLTEKSQENCGGTALLTGLTCTLNTSFLPLALGSYSEALTVQGNNGRGVTANLSGVGVYPEAAISIALSQPLVAGGTTTSISATVTQPHGTNTPSGSVTFVYTVNEGNVNRGGSTGTVTVNLVPAGGNAAIAVLNLSGLLPARRYSVSATYNGDAQDTANTTASLTFIVPGGTVLTVVANPATFAYGAPVPNLTGTVTGILPADAAAMSTMFTTTATSTSGVGQYPVTLLLSGGNYLNYVVPAAVTSSGAPALVTVTPAPLNVTANSVSTVYGSQNLTYTSSVTGVVNGDVFTITYSPAKSQTLDVGTYVLVPTLSGPFANYTVTTTNGALTVTQAAASVADTANASAVLPQNLGSELVSISVQSSTTGTPTGTVTLADSFTPLNAAMANAPVNIGPLTLINGAATYTPTSQTFGTHSYTISYSGDLNFQVSTTTTPTTVIVDNPDFFLTLPTTPLLVLPGVIPGGNQNILGESSATPETAIITVAPILNYTGTINFTCSSPSSYVTCSFSSPSILISSKTAQTTILSVSTPATLPVDYKGSVRSKTVAGPVWAFLPLGLLAALPFARNRRRKLPRLAVIVLISISFGMELSGCGSTNLVQFFTPVPQGEQQVTITATDGISTKTSVLTISIQ